MPSLWGKMNQDLQHVSTQVSHMNDRDHNTLTPLFLTVSFI